MENMMKVERIHPVSHEINVLDLDITEKEINEYMSGVSVQEAFPRLDADEREFIISGLMPGEYDKLFDEEMSEKDRALRKDHQDKIEIDKDQNNDKD